MLGFSDFSKELKRVAPDCEEITIGSLIGFRHWRTTGLHKFLYVNLFVEELGFVHVVARDHFDDELLSNLVNEFERNRIKKYKPTELRVYVGRGLKDFDCYGIAPPLLAKPYQYESELLKTYGYQLFPMYGIEFMNHFSEEQFWTQRLRKDKWAVNILRWDRKIEVSGYGRSST